MGKFCKILFRTFAIIFLGTALVVGLFLTGIIESPVFLDVYNTKSYDQPQESESDSNSSSSGSSSNSISTSSSSSSSNSTNIPSALNVKLTGTYLTTYNNAVKYLTADDLKAKMIIKIGLQILQQGVIKYELACHYYSITYSNNGNTQYTQYYNLKDCINRINNKQKIYTDCFGFARLTYSIACYTLNSANPEGVEGLNQMYGYKGGYGNGVYITNLSYLKGGAMLYDTLTGSGSSKNRHVAIFLYASGKTVTYMDQAGVYTGEYQSSGYIYSARSSNPYKFNKYKVFC